MVLPRDRLWGVSTSSEFIEMSEPVYTCATRRESWLQRMERFAQSNLTVKNFCAQENISVPSFYQWKKKLAPTKATESRVAAFLPVQLDPLLRTLSGLTIQVNLPGGAQVQVPQGLGSEAMVTLFTAIIRASSAAVELPR